MQLLLIVGVVAALASASSSESAVGHLWLRSLGTLLAVVFTALLAFRIARRAASPGRGTEANGATGAVWLDRALCQHAVVWLCLTLCVMYLFDWPGVLRAWPWLNRWPLLDDVALLAPVVVPWWCSWFVLARLDAGAQVNHQVARRSPRAAAWQYAWFQTRQHFVPLLAPLLLLLCLEDAVRLYAPHLRESSSESLAAPLVVVAFFLSFPLLLRWLWPTRRLEPGPLRAALTHAAAQRKWPVNEFLLWQTGKRMVNAAVAGLLPGMRYVFLSDALLAQFSTEQVEAVVAHEVGHVRRGHLMLRLLVLGVPALFLILMTRLGAQELSDSESLRQAGWWDAQLGGEDWLLPVGMLIYAAFVLGRFCRLLELEADFDACLAGDNSLAMCPDRTAIFLSTLARLAATGGVAPDVATWLHPSLTQRAEFLLALWRSPESRARFSQSMRRLRWALWLLGAVGLLLNVALA